MRLYKLIKINGFTKSEVIELSSKNLITVNDKIIPLTTNVLEKDIIKVNGFEIKWPKFRYFLYNKPKGIESTISEKNESYIKNIELKDKMMIAGRLDKLSSGLMILSNDGDFINDIQTNPDIKKTYIVSFEKEITESFLNGFNNCYIIRGRKTTPITYEVIDNKTLKLILSEGVYHQIRHITKLNGNKVNELLRIKIGKYELKDLKEGEIKEIEI